MLDTVLEIPPSAGIRASHRTDVVTILGYASWSGCVRRGHVHPEDRLTLELMRSPRVGRLLVCNPFRSRIAKLARSVAGPRDAPFPELPDVWLHEPLRLRRADPTDLRAIEAQARAYERSVRRRADELGLEQPIVITAHPLLAGFGDFDWARSVTYYATDDQTTHAPLSAWWPGYEASFARARAAGRHAVAVTPDALRSFGPSGPAAVVPNGLDPEEWRDPGPAPDWFTALPSPRLVYVGTLDDRLDVDAVRAASEAVPGGSVTLIGRCPDPEFVAELRELPNVTIAPPVGRGEIAGLVAAADAGLIPHVNSAVTRSMSPLKLYEYLAAGLPVASVALPAITDVCPERTAFADGAQDFKSAVSQALALGRWSERNRNQFIDDNTWEQRSNHVLDIALAD